MKKGEGAIGFVSLGFIFSFLTFTLLASFLFSIPIIMMFPITASIIISGLIYQRCLR